MLQVENNKKFHQLLELAYDHCRREIYCFLGAPGIGKTQQIYQFAEERGANVEEIHGPGVLPSEISGITMPDTESRLMDVFDNVKLSRMKDGDILLLDEILKSPPAVMNAMLTLIQERRTLSGTPLPDIMIVAASNLGEAKLNRIDPAFLNRFSWVSVGFNAESWTEYVCKKHGLDHQGNIAKWNLITDAISKHVESLENENHKWNMLTPRRMEIEIEKTISLMSKADENTDPEEIKDTLDMMFLQYDMMAESLASKISNAVYNIAKKKTGFNGIDLSVRGFVDIAKDLMDANGYVLGAMDEEIFNEIVDADGLKGFLKKIGLYDKFIETLNDMPGTERDDESAIEF